MNKQMPILDKGFYDRRPIKFCRFQYLLLTAVVLAFVFLTLLAINQFLVLTT